MSHIDELIRYTRKQLKRLNSNLKQSVATGDVEAIHDLRVACRRLEEPLDLITKLTKNGSGKDLQRNVQCLRRAFRDVRDLDVLLLGLSAAPADSTLDSGGLARLEGTLSAQRQQRFSRALKKHRRFKPNQFASQIDRFRKRLGKVKESADIDAQLAEMLFQRRADLLAYDPHRTDPADLHKARIRLKRFRYAIELACFIKHNDEDELLESLMQMQEWLGKWNDHLAAVSIITEIAGEKTLPMHTEWSARLLHYAASRAEAAEEFRRRIFENWPSFLSSTQSSTDAASNHASMGEDAHAVINPK